ncbi:MAG TPA: DNA/RNA non-specific endonuclease, partial [Planctomycetia bacterium]|nr:DNA/RNA non-specific endonuclease [Planctomycetia bacterium]
NQLAWERFERHCRDLAYSGRELFIVAGPNGAGGEGLKGPRTTIGRSRIAVPAETWKVALSLPAGKVKPSDVTATNAKLLALVTPNDQSVGEDWRRYETTLAEVERRTGYRFFSNVAPDVLKSVAEASAPKEAPQGKSPGGGDKSKQAKPKQPLKGGIGR